MLITLRGINIATMSMESLKTYEAPAVVDEIPKAEALERIFKDKYNEARARITIPDEEIIRKVMAGEGHSFSDPTEQLLMVDLRYKNIALYLETRLRGKPLYDVGGGKSGVGHFLGMRAIDPPLRIEGLSTTKIMPDVTDIDFGVSEYTLIDPFLDGHETIETSLAVHKVRTREDITEKKREEVIKSIQVTNEDGLTALSKLPDGAGNVVMSSIDYDLIGNNDYLKRLAQEAFRVVPIDGIFLVNNCPDVQSTAGMLFPYSEVFGTADSIAYAKEPIPAKIPDWIISNEGVYSWYKKALDAKKAGKITLTKDIFSSTDEQPDEAEKEETKSFFSDLGFEISDVVIAEDRMSATASIKKVGEPKEDEP